MGKILIIYHSQQYGNTKALAEAFAQGANEAGGEVDLINTNDRRVMLDEFLAADAVAIGTPDYFSYLAGTIKTFFDDIYQWNQSGEHVKGKPAALFFSHGGGGRVRQHLKDFADRFFNQIGEMVEGRTPISTEAKKKCFALGRELANKVK